MNYLLPERLDRLAREYALGTLAGPARRRFERLMRNAPAAARAVVDWQQRLSVLESSPEPKSPPASTWTSLERRLFATSGTETTPAPSGKTSSRRPSRTPPSSSGWAAALGRWFPGRVLGGALAGVMLCAVLLRSQPAWIGMEPQTQALPASYVGLLLDKSDKPALLVSSRRKGRQVTVKLLQPLAIPDGQIAQLWALPQDGSAPFLVGTIPSSGSARIMLPDASDKVFSTVTRLAVSFETSTPRTPTSGFVLAGHCVKLW